MHVFAASFSLREGCHYGGIAGDYEVARQQTNEMIKRIKCDTSNALSGNFDLPISQLRDFALISCSTKAVAPTGAVMITIVVVRSPKYSN